MKKFLSLVIAGSMLAGMFAGTVNAAEVPASESAYESVSYESSYVYETEAYEPEVYETEVYEPVTTVWDSVPWWEYETEAVTTAPWDDYYPETTEWDDYYPEETTVVVEPPMTTVVVEPPVTMTEIVTVTDIATEIVTEYVPDDPEEIYSYRVSDGMATIIDVYESISGDVIIPDTLGGYPVVAIGDLAFSDCDSITSITLPDSITSIDVWAFYSCDLLINISIPEGVTRIDDRAFEYCYNLEEIIVSQGNAVYKDIDGVLFTADGSVLMQYPCGNSRTEYIIPDGVTSIGDSAFYGCNNLIRITFSDSVTTIGYEALACCSNLMDINVSEGNETYKDIDGILFNIDCSEIIQYPCGIDATEYIIPDGVTSIGNSAFYGCDSIVSITIPGSVTSIGNSAFWGCTNLVSIAIPYGVTDIASHVFVDCSSLVNVTIPGSVTTIRKEAFVGCNSLTSITLPDGVTSIGDASFGGCPNLVSITIPNSVTSIDYYAFSGCNNLVIYCSSMSYAAEYAESEGIPVIYTDPVSEIIIESMPLKTTYPLNGVINLDGLSLKVIFENGNELVITTGFTVGEYDFSTEGTKTVTVSVGTASVQFDVYVDPTMVEYPESAHPYANDTYQRWEYTHNTDADFLAITFSEDTYTENGCDVIYIFDHVTGVGSGYSGSVLAGRTVYVPGNSFSIELDTDGSVNEYGFKITNIEGFSGDCIISDGVYVKYIGNDSNVVIPDGVTSIAAEAFVDCYSLTSVVIPDGVTIIEDYAFAACENLVNVTIPDSVTGIGYDSFSYCPNVVFNCSLGSFAEEYASWYGIPVAYTDPVSEVSIVSMPYITTYPVGGTLNLSGLVLKLVFEDGNEVVVSSGFSAEYDFSEAGAQFVTIYYGSLSVQIEMFVDADMPVYPESAHPYASYTNETWNYTHNREADSLMITFSENTYTESHYDYIYIYDFNGEEIGCYSGSELSGVTVTIPGNSFSIRLTSDGSVCLYGFTITDISAVDNDFVISGNALVKYNGTNPTAMIPYGITNIRPMAFMDNTSVEMIVIPEGAISIGEYAFSWCESLTNVFIPDSVTYIEEDAFLCSDNVVICCTEDSYAHSYAEEYGIAVSLITDVYISSLPGTTVYSVGDTLDLSGCALNIVCDNMSTTTITSGFGVMDYDFSTAGTKTISVCYAGVTAQFEVTVEPRTIPGDVNGNGVVNLEDIILLMKYMSRWDVDIHLSAADANGDGKISLRDVSRLMQYIAGWDVVLG